MPAERMNAMRYIIKALLIAAVFLQVFSLTVEALPRSVGSVGHLTVGGKLPGYSGISQSGIDVGPAEPKGEFHIHLIDDQLSPSCLDLECSDEMRCVVDRGAHVVGSSDGKLAKLFGIKLVSTRPWKLSAKVAIISSPDRTILNIYEDASISDVCSILSSGASNRISTQGDQLPKVPTS